jgi:hypothetical protein
VKNLCLQEIKVQSAKNLQQGLKNLFVFDLDSTLFDVTPRSKKIIEDFSTDPAHADAFPNETPLLRHIQMSPTDWGIRSSIERLPFVSEPPAEFFIGVKNYWMERFFASDYLHHDVPYAGAVTFVNHLAAHTDNHIVYLTGRDIKRMLVGTERSLALSGFPIDRPNVQLALKPHTDIPDTEFKCQWFSQIEPLHYANIWFFENEPVNIERVVKDHPQVAIIFFDSTHSGRSPSPTQYPIISDYL